MNLLHLVISVEEVQLLLKQFNTSLQSLPGLCKDLVDFVLAHVTTLVIGAC